MAKARPLCESAVPSSPYEIDVRPAKHAGTTTKENTMQSHVTPLHPSLFDTLRKDPEILTLIEKSDAALAAMGYTDHGRRHVTLVATNAARLLARLRYDARTSDIAAVAALLHDIGNCAGRHGHASAGATLAYQLLVTRGIPPADAADIMAAIGNHDEIEQGVIVSVPCAALVLADKADIHRSRVRSRNPQDFDAHDRANYAVTSAQLDADPKTKRITLRLVADSTFAATAEFIELFGARFAMSESAAHFLGCSYGVEINGEVVR